MSTQQEKDYWAKVRQEQADARRHAASKYTYVPDWEFHKDQPQPDHPATVPKSKWPLIAAICLICSVGCFVAYLILKRIL